MQFEFDLGVPPVTAESTRLPRLPAKRAAHVAAGPHLPGLEPGRIYALFFVLKPPLPAADAFTAIIRRSLDGQRATAGIVGHSRLHVSLQPVATREHIPAAITEAALVAGRMVAAEPFDVSFDHLESFRLGEDNHALVAVCGTGKKRILGLQSAIAAALRARGMPARARKFEPHVTLRYGRRPFALFPVEPVRWRVDGFQLIVSPHGLTQHRLVPGGLFGLGGASPKAASRS